MNAAAAERHIRSGRQARYVDDGIEAFWLAELGGQVVGMAHWHGGFVEALHVRSQYRRMGVGRQLLAIAEGEMRRAGLPSARLETDSFNEASRSFYAALGYVELDRYPDTEWDCGFTTILLEKRLC